MDVCLILFLYIRYIVYNKISDSILRELDFKQAIRKNDVTTKLLVGFWKKPSEVVICVYKLLFKKKKYFVLFIFVILVWYEFSFLVKFIFSSRCGSDPTDSPFEATKFVWTKQIGPEKYSIDSSGPRRTFFGNFDLKSM